MSGFTRDSGFARRRHCHLLHPQCRRLPPPPRHCPQKPHVRLLSSLSLPYLHLLDRPENILYSFNDPISDIVIVDFGMQVPIHFPPLIPFCSSLRREKLPHSPHGKLTSLLATSLPKSSEMPVIGNWSTSMIASTRIHRRNTSSWLSLSLHSHHHLCSLLQLSPFSCQHCHHHRPIERQPPNLRVRTGTRFRSSQVLHPTSRLPQFTPSSRCPGGFMRSLAYPYYYRRHAIPHRRFPHSQTKLNSQSDIRAANRFSYFVATTSRLSMQSSKGWRDQDPELRVGTQALLKEE